ncbi:MAG: UDP-N-acetylmuramate dehydrogenase [Pseudomonadota bacterium]
MFDDITGIITARARTTGREIRGRLTANANLAAVTWFRAGGPAQALFSPADEADLASVLSATPGDIPISVLGLGSNTLVRDGGVPGLVVRLGKPFSNITIEDGHRVRVGTAVRDKQLAKAASEAGVSGLQFYAGIPGGIGGALRMNAGDKRPDGENQIDASGRQRTDTSEHVIEIRAVTRQGEIVTLDRDALGYGYRTSSVAQDLIFTEALFQGTAGDPDALLAEMAEVERYREEHQPTKGRTGGSTFKNPPGQSAWKLIDEAGCRGLRIGSARMSEQHCNFLLADEGASAFDIETLGETVRRRVYETSSVLLEWEIKRIGLFGATGEVEMFAP